MSFYINHFDYYSQHKNTFNYLFFIIEMKPINDGLAYVE